MASELLPLLSGDTPHKGCRVHIALILDDDLGFIFWLGLALQKAACQAMPAKSVRSARALLRRLGVQVGLVVFNPALPGVERFLQDLRRTNPDLKAVAALAADAEVEPPAFVPFRLRKPAALDDQTAAEWVSAIQRASGGGGAVPAV